MLGMLCYAMNRSDEPHELKRVHCVVSVAVRAAGGFGQVKKV